MICILLLSYLTSCVCGTFVVNVTQSSYQAEENGNITLEWMFTTKPDSSTDSLSIFCELITDRKTTGLFHFEGGVEVQKSQDERFAGRVRSDKDVLREGRIRLQVSRLRTDDSGQYLCEVLTNYGGNFGGCRLNVTASHRHKDERQQTSRGTTTCHCRLGLAGVLLVHFTSYLVFGALR